MNTYPNIIKALEYIEKQFIESEDPLSLSFHLQIIPPDKEHIGEFVEGVAYRIRLDNGYDIEDLESSPLQCQFKIIHSKKTKKMKTKNLKCHAFLGCMCFGAAIYDDFQFAFSFTDEQLARLRALYKGKEDLDLELIEDTMPELYEAIRHTANQKATSREHSPISMDIHFLKSIFKN